MREKIRIGVIGGSNPTERAKELAYEVGKLIARAGAVLVCGGLGGVMEAAAKGAKEEGGFTIGILPGKDRDSANPYIDLPVVTNIGYLRNAMVVLNSDVVIAVDGSYGTLSEIAYAMIYGIKVIGIETWNIEGIEVASSPSQAVEKALREIRG
jgi:hypothetical protein